MNIQGTCASASASMVFTGRTTFYYNQKTIPKLHQVSKSLINQPRLNIRAALSAQDQHADPKSIGESDTGVYQPALQLYNTMTRSVETFTSRPDSGKNVSMYVCGVTVYDDCHIGHARVYVTFDVLQRVLQTLGYSVKYVRNFTDIDDKIIKRSNELNIPYNELVDRYIDAFYEDMDALRCTRPFSEPRATEYIPAMIELIQKILDNGHGYVQDGSVFCDPSKLQGYGKLSQQVDITKESQYSRLDQGTNTKRSSNDFVLWKSSKPGEPCWESPWGQGRPGWHIECSAMITKIMGPVIDIHGGGRDLMFPHHENELAQCRAAGCGCEAEGEEGSGRYWVRYWVHNGFIEVGQEKMSKSLGNFSTIKEVLQKHHPMAVRWFIIRTSYRQVASYTQSSLLAASQNILELFKSFSMAMDEINAQITDDSDRQRLVDAAKAYMVGDDTVPTAWHLSSQNQQQNNSKTKKKKKQKNIDIGRNLYRLSLGGLCNDLQTGPLVKATTEGIGEVTRLFYTKAGRKDPNKLFILIAVTQYFLACGDLLAIPVGQSDLMVQEMKALALSNAGYTEQSLQEKIQEREEKRGLKLWEEVDEMRAKLREQGISLQDTPQGTVWEPWYDVNQ